MGRTTIYEWKSSGKLIPQQHFIQKGRTVSQGRLKSVTVAPVRKCEYSSVSFSSETLIFKPSSLFFFRSFSSKFSSQINPIHR